MANINELENKSIYIIREAYKRFRNLALPWSMGKDSTVLLWLCKKAFYNKIPFPVIHIDTERKFPEIYKFRDKYTKKWNLNLIIAKNKDELKKQISPKNKFQCCTQLKTEALKQTLAKHKFDALLMAIRRDEHAIRSMERYFSPRDKKFRWNVFKLKKKSNKQGDSPFEALQDTELSGWGIFATDFGKKTNHIRVHPLLHWTEKDIWQYIKQEKIPVVSLYFSKKGKDGWRYRYRSIGCACCCKPILSKAKNTDQIIKELETTKIKERSGRGQDKESEYMMQKLRVLGYM